MQYSTVEVVMMTRKKINTKKNKGVSEFRIVDERRRRSLVSRACSPGQRPRPKLHDWGPDPVGFGSLKNQMLFLS